MFSYQNKIVGIKMTGQAGSDFVDILLNGAYVGSTSGSGASYGVNLIGSDNTSLSFAEVLPFPESVIFHEGDDSNNSQRYESPYYSGEAGRGYYLNASVNLIYNNEWELRDAVDNSLIVLGGSDLSQPYGLYEVTSGYFLRVMPPRPSEVLWSYEDEFIGATGLSTNVNSSSGAYFEIVPDNSAPNYLVLADYDYGNGYPYDNWAVETVESGGYYSISGVLASGGPYYGLPYRTYSGSTGVSGASPYALTISPTGETGSYWPLPTYHFSDLLLNVGFNEICFINSNAITGNTPLISHQIDLYDVSGYTLVNPISIDPSTTTATTISGWSVSYSDTASRWNITNSGFELDFRVEANEVCGGSNQERQIATAATNIALLPSESLSFDYAITSEVEVLNAGYDTTYFRISVDDVELASNTLESITSGGEPCAFETVSGSGSFSYTNNTAASVVATIAIDFDTEDEAANVANGIGTNLKINNFQTTSAQSNNLADQCYLFDLQYPTGRSISLVEIPPVFNVDTGNLNQVFTGSGVHLKKDVTFFFDILDQQLNTVSSNQQFLENPLIDRCVFDILNADGTTAAASFLTGTSRSITVSALDNQDVFGSYQKDFGIRCKLPNTFDGSIFTGEFYAYGNVPNILDIAPDYTEFSGAAQATERINASIVLQNDLNFTQMDRYDVYALTGSGSAVNELTYLAPFAQEGYLFSQSAADVVNARSLTINRGTLPQDVPHYFTVVPYGTLGSGSAFTFGPATFVTVENIIVRPETNSSALNLYHGNSFGQTIYKTGKFFSDTGILHEFSSGQFSSVKYFIEVSGSGQRILSELRGVVNTTGFDLTKESVNDATTQYQLTGSTSGQCGLFASGSGYANYSYKLQATTI